VKERQETARKRARRGTTKGRGTRACKKKTYSFDPADTDVLDDISKRPGLGGHERNRVKRRMVTGLDVF